jgi:arylsulfatase A
MAANGIRFTQPVSQPLCTPTRVKIMTGRYNYKNYVDFGYLKSNQQTFGNVMKEAGYATCIAGKWQLNGLSYKDKYEEWNDPSRPVQFGFDEYCLWQLTKEKKEGERFANPKIEQNGEVLETNIDDYGPDIFADFVTDFIERKKDQPFFVYYPMVLVHAPFVPTPDSDEWANPKLRYKKDNKFFKDMVEYTDEIVGRILQKLEDLGIEENTIVIFTGDNGTHGSITTQTVNGPVKGGKGTMKNAGTRVPLVMQYPKAIKEGKVYEGLVEFSDFFPTFAEIAGVEVESDGQSFLSLLTGEGEYNRETAFVHYNPLWGKSRTTKRFARTVRYKLHQDGSFFDLSVDELEKNNLSSDSLSADELKVKTLLQAELDKAPK